jgi:hypothetical protein
VKYQATASEQQYNKQARHHQHLDKQLLLQCITIALWQQEKHEDEIDG